MPYNKPFEPPVLYPPFKPYPKNEKEFRNRRQDLWNATESETNRVPNASLSKPKDNDVFNKTVPQPGNAPSHKAPSPVTTMPAKRASSGRKLEPSSKSQAPPPATRLLTGALAKHLAASTGATSLQARKLVQQQVVDFMRSQQAKDGPMDISDLSGFQAKLKKQAAPLKPHSENGGLGCPQPPSSQLFPGSLPGVSHQYLAQQEEILNQERQRHIKCDKKGRGNLRQILQAKMNDPWGQMTTCDAERYRQEMDQKRQDRKERNMKWRQDLDQLMVEKHERHRKEEEAAAEYRRLENLKCEALEKEQKEKEERRAAHVQVLMKDQQEQISTKKERLRREAEQREKDRQEFNARIAKEQAAAEADAEARRNYNKQLMKSYMAESDASMKVKAENIKKEAQADAKAKKEWEEQLNTWERKRKEDLDNKKLKQDMQEKAAIGKTWEKQYISQEIIDKNMRLKNEKDNKDEARRLARIVHLNQEFVAGLATQQEEINWRKQKEADEKQMWNEHFVREANQLDRQHKDQLKKKMNNRQSWVRDLNGQLAEFQYDQAFAPASMSRTDRLMNIPKFEILKTGFECSSP